jgi:hypothetical protein
MRTPKLLAEQPSFFLGPDGSVLRVSATASKQLPYLKYDVLRSRTRNVPKVRVRIPTDSESFRSKQSLSCCHFVARW